MPIPSREFETFHSDHPDFVPFSEIEGFDMARWKKYENRHAHALVYREQLEQSIRRGSPVDYPSSSSRSGKRYPNNTSEMARRLSGWNFGRDFRR